MTIAMKNSGEGGTPVGNESMQETTAIGNTVSQINFTFTAASLTV
jgi:hypothetical protein